MADQLDDARDNVELLGVQLEAKRADLQEAQAMLRQAQRTSGRLNSLAQRGAVDGGEVERAHTEVEVLEARLLGKQAQVRESEVRLKQARRHLEKLQTGAASRSAIPHAMQPPMGYPTPDTTPAPQATGATPPGFSPDHPAAGVAPGSAPPGAFGAVPSPAGEAPRSGTGQGQGSGFGMGGAITRGERAGGGVTRGGMGGSGGMPGGGMGGPAMPGQMMMMGRASGGSGDPRLDNLEKRLDGLARDVRTLKQLADAQRRQEALLQDLVTELRQMRQSQQKPRESSRP